MKRVSRAAPAPPPPNARSRVLDFLPRLADRCEEVWTLDRMAEACGMGRTHFARWTKEITGDTPLQHLNRKRVEKAAAMLQTGQTTITDTALACGFQSSQYFATVFKTFTGHTPRENRERPIQGRVGQIRRAAPPGCPSKGPGKGFSESRGRP